MFSLIVHASKGWLFIPTLLELLPIVNIPHLELISPIWHQLNQSLLTWSTIKNTIWVCLDKFYNNDLSHVLQHLFNKSEVGIIFSLLSFKLIVFCIINDILLGKGGKEKNVEQDEN